MQSYVILGENLKWVKMDGEIFKKLFTRKMKRKNTTTICLLVQCVARKKSKKISDLNRTASVAMLGVASSKIGKQYECDNCQHKW